MYGSSIAVCHLVQCSNAVVYILCSYCYMYHKPHCRLEGHSQVGVEQTVLTSHYLLHHLLLYTTSACLRQLVWAVTMSRHYTI